MNYLGIDFGLTSIGVAYSDENLASPLKTLSTSKSLKLLPAIISELSVDQIIIGMPDGPAKKPAQEFIKQLAFLNVPIVTVDETLSSHDARISLLHTSVSRRKKKEHSVSAAIILQSWLDGSR